MALQGKIVARAREALAEDRKTSEAELGRRRQEVYARLPQVREIDSQLQKLMIDVIALALKKGEDPARAIDDIGGESLDLQAKRAELLSESGYPIDYIDEKYRCDSCSDTGYVKGIMCGCLRDRYTVEMKKELSRLLRLGEERFETFDSSYYDNVQNPETGVSPREYMQAVFQTCKDYAGRFSQSSVNLLFQGGTGLGKTFLSSCIARVVSERGFSVVYDTAVSVLEAFENQKFWKGQEQWESANSHVRGCLECDLLILDDLGTEMTTAMSSSALYTLINTRLVRGGKTLINTNLTNDELWRRYTPQIMSRLEGEYLNLNFIGRDIRTIKKERGFA